MKKRIFLLVMLAVVLTGCTPAAEESATPTPDPVATHVATASPTPTQEAEESATPTPDPVTTHVATASPTPTQEAADFAGLNAAEEPPLPDPARELDIPEFLRVEVAYPAPEFLSEELQTLYRRMRYVYRNLFDGSLDLFDDYWPLAEGQEQAAYMEGPSLEAPWGRESYYVATRRYAAWADFDAMIHSLMTDRLFQEKNETLPLPLFQEYQGRTAYLPTSKSNGSDYRNYFFPDTFELIEQTGDTIRFYVVGYYSANASMQDGETYEEWTQRIQKGYDETRKFEIVLVQTENGWRFDRFAITEI